MRSLRHWVTAPSSGTDAARRGPAVAVALLLAAGPLAVVVAGQVTVSAGSACGPAGEVMRDEGGRLMCAHADEAPPGVDVTEHVSTAELKSREGAGVAAYQAAEELGVPMTPAANAVSPAVSCDGDGEAGYRVQAMYVVGAGRPNRYAELKAQMKIWAAGTDDVINRSAALTGGVRNVRYVTEAGPETGCEARVLNVTVPAGSLSTFGASIDAVRAQGYDNPARKYLMWTDTTTLCGIALMYLSDNPAQGNPNNGSHPQYARVDSGCWGMGDGTGQHSVEAHELVHALGGIQGSAPHATSRGHCWDESDTMCYADGGGKAMVQVCPPEREYLLDCNTDDYFSTYPDPGSYLDTHWNSADSRFLIGGGDGAGGGSAGSPTVLGATIGVNNPAVPGLSTQVSVTPSVPAGRTITNVTWRSARRDCTFATPAELQSLVTCAATATGSTTVSVTLTDSTSATRTISSPLTFSSGVPRPVSLSLSLAGQDTGPASVCTGAAFPVQATVVDQASGKPVKGLTAVFSKKTGAMVTPGAAGSALTLDSGTATVNGAATLPTAYTARTNAGAAYAAAAPVSWDAVPGRCAPVLTGVRNADQIYHGEPVTVSGTLTRPVDGRSVPVAGASLPVRLVHRSGTTTRVLTLGTARTAADGSYSLVVKPTVSGSVSVVLPASTAYLPAAVELGDLTVHANATDLTATVDRTDVGYGDSVLVSGRLTKTSGLLTTGEVTSNLGAAAISVRVTAPGRKAVVVGSGRTLSDGTFRIVLPLRLSGTMDVVYAGAAGLPADTVTLGEVTSGTWSTAVSLRPVSGAQPPLTGTVTRTYAGVTEAAKGLRVKLYFTPTSTGVRVLATTVTTTTSGGFVAKLYPSVNGTYTAVVSATAGYADATSDGVAVTAG